jgi:hypothetical protein
MAPARAAPLASTGRYTGHWTIGPNRRRRPDVQPSTKRAEQPGVSWLSLKTPAQAAAASARLDADRAHAAAALVAAVNAGLTDRKAAGPTLSYDDAVALVCDATGWPVGHVWLATANGWQSSGAWHDEGTQFAELKTCTATTELGAGRGIVAAVLFLEACRFLPGLEGLGSPERRHHALALGLVGVVGVPVVRNGRVEAVMEFITRSEVEPDGDLTEALLAVAAQTRRWTPGQVITASPRAVALDVAMPVHLAG